MPRTVCWFSCGAPSAVAAKLTIASGRFPVEVVYTYVAEEHPDNARFLVECELWLNLRIRSIGNTKYAASIYNVFERERYLVGISGAPCTKLLKRQCREQFQLPDDIHVLGYTAEEQERLADFKEAYPSLTIECPLIERGLSKADCLAMIQDAGIELPAMYRLGYNNNNCVGCVKGGMGYWNKIRHDFPEVFMRMAWMERQIGHAICRNVAGPVYLDELDPKAGRDVPQPTIDCSIMCLLSKQEYAG